MKELQEIIEAYAAADEERRLYMFLSYRDLRQEFGAIEAGAWQPERDTSEKPVSVEKVKTVLQRAFGCCQGWLKHCRSDR